MSLRLDRGRDEDFFALTAFYVDIDDDVTAKAKSIYLECNCRPTGVVVTGRHPHVRAQMLWRLEEPVRDAATCREQNIALAKALGGDPSVVNAGRVSASWWLDCLADKGGTRYRAYGVH